MSGQAPWAHGKCGSCSGEHGFCGCSLAARVHHRGAYALDFALESPGPTEFFLKSRGYYYEWMLDAWLDSPQVQPATRWFTDSKAVLEELAPDYKRIEAKIEEYFWRSRLAPRVAPGDNLRLETVHPSPSIVHAERR